MNERIRLLAEQATSTLSVNHEGYRGKGYTEQVEFFDKEKFAELIVRECGQVAWKYTPDTEELEYSHLIKDKILKRFGVEE